MAQSRRSSEVAPSRKSSQDVQRKDSVTDPFKDLPIVWIIGTLIIFQSTIYLLHIEII